MKNKKTIHLSITISLLSILIIAPIFALGDTRKVELTGFLEELQDEIDEDFKDTISSGDTDIYATCSAIKIHTMLESTVSDSLSILKDTIEGKIQGYTTDKDIEKLAFALEGLDTIGGISGLGTENTNNIHILLNSFKETHGSNIGFRMSENENVTVTGTYYALKCFYHLDHTMSNITSNLTSINSYVLSCYNSTVGGFISNTTDLSAPNLLNTYFSVQIYNYTNQIGSLTAAVISKIDNYIDSFYISNVNDEDNLGGYIDSSDSSKATFSATYHSVLTLNTLNSNVKPSENTVNWILEHQNPIDGGFSSIKASEGLESISSCIISYYAVKIISLSENGLLWLDEQAWGLYVDWLLVLGISLLIVAIAIAIILGYKRRMAI